MRTIVVVLLASLAIVAAVPAYQQRIVGGSVTTINAYPFAAALLHSENLATYVQSCGGTIINNRSILTAAHCVIGDPANRWRIRVGSTFANSGGTVHNAGNLIVHPQYNTWTHDRDVAIIRSASNFNYVTGTVAAAFIAGTSYNLADYQAVWAIGWGTTSSGGSFSEQLRHVQIWTVNQGTCAQRYAELGYGITDNMMCSGWLDVGGRDQCEGDSGGPLLHNGPGVVGVDSVVIGLYSFGFQCGNGRYPSVNTRVSTNSLWIVDNA